MLVNSVIKHELETLLELIKGQVLDFVCYFATVWQSKVTFIGNFSTEYNIRYLEHHLMPTKC